MLPIIVLSHGTFAKSLLETAEMILGKQENVLALQLLPDDSPEALKKNLESAILSFEDASKLCIFTDILSGTPFNTVVGLSRSYPFQHIAGINLPLFIEALTMREYVSAEELSEHVIEASKTCTVHVNKLMSSS